MKHFVVILFCVFLLMSCAGKNIQTTNNYDGFWNFKMYIGHKYNHDKISIVNGKFHKKYPNNSKLKGYISADGGFSASYSFNKGGWNMGNFIFSLDRAKSTESRLAGKWSGLDGAYMTKEGIQYSGGDWEAIKIN